MGSFATIYEPSAATFIVGILGDTTEEDVIAGFRDYDRVVAEHFGGRRFNVIVNADDEAHGSIASLRQIRRSLENQKYREYVDEVVAVSGNPTVIAMREAAGDGPPFFSDEQQALEYLTARMRRQVTENLDRIAHEYAERFCHELDDKPFDRSLLKRFAEAVSEGAICDLGCGPGHVAAYLASACLAPTGSASARPASARPVSAGSAVIGIDLSPQMIAEARRRYPGIDFRAGDMLDLQIETGSLGGVVAFYSIVSLRPDMLPRAFQEMSRVLRSGGRLLVSFHRGSGVVHTDDVFGTGASFDATLFEVDEVTSVMDEAGFSVAETTVRRPYSTEYPRQRVYIVADKRETAS